MLVYFNVLLLITAKVTIHMAQSCALINTLTSEWVHFSG